MNKKVRTKTIWGVKKRTAITAFWLFVFFIVVIGFGAIMGKIEDRRGMQTASVMVTQFARDVEAENYPAAYAQMSSMYIENHTPEVFLKQLQYSARDYHEIKEIVSKGVKYQQTTRTSKQRSTGCMNYSATVIYKDGRSRDMTAIFRNNKRTGAVEKIHAIHISSSKTPDEVTLDCGASEFGWSV